MHYVFLRNVFFYLCIDMVVLVVVTKPDPAVYSVDIVEYFVMKVKKKYEDREEMINLGL